MLATMFLDSGLQLMCRLTKRMQNASLVHMSCKSLDAIGILQGGMDSELLAIAHTAEVYNPSASLDTVLRHPLELQSAYMEVTGSEPEFTSCHDRFCGTVDYIWFTPKVSCHSISNRHTFAERIFSACPAMTVTFKLVTLRAGLSICCHNAHSVQSCPSSSAQILLKCLQVGAVKVVPSSVLNPPAQYLVSNGLPTADFPSDHVSIVCDFHIVSHACAA